VTDVFEHDAPYADEAPKCGPIETKVRNDLASLITVHPMALSLAEMSYRLARTLDEGAGLAVAAVNRELRANLVELARLGMVDDEDLESDLSTPVRDSPES
jgi:hypothetical protein